MMERVSSAAEESRLRNFSPLSWATVLWKSFLVRNCPTSAALSYFEGIKFGCIFFPDAIDGGLYLFQRQLFFIKPKALLTSSVISWR